MDETNVSTAAVTFSRQLLSNGRAPDLKNNASLWHTMGAGLIWRRVDVKIEGAHRVAQNSNVPLPLPIRVSLPCCMQVS